MQVLEKDFLLSNGLAIPALGLGFWQVKPEDAARVVEEGIEVGYRHIDTAIAYGNEKEVGEGLKHARLPRESVYLTSKIPAEIKSYEEAKACIDASLERLQTPYLDLMLIHAPKPWSEMRDSTKPYRYEKENLAVYQAMEEAYAAGKIRSLGVSNFLVSDLQNILVHAKVRPVVNQIPCYVGHVEKEVIDFCGKEKILVEGYSPLATGQLIGNPEVEAIAKKLHVSLAQICIRYVYQLGVLPLPKTTHKDFMMQNAAIDFVLSPEDMKALGAIAFTRKPQK